MFKAARWRGGDKNKIKAVFKFQFNATQVPQLGWEVMMVSLVPLDVGRPSARSEKVAVADGACRWTKPVFETVKLSQDPKSGKINEKAYQFIVSATGSAKAGLLGEATINLADHAEVFKPLTVSLPLRPSSTGAVLHVTLQRVHGDVEAREADGYEEMIQQQHRTLENQLNHTKEEAKGVPTGTNNITCIEEHALIGTKKQPRVASSRPPPLRADRNGGLRKSSSSDTISALSSDSSSDRYTPKENGINTNNSHHDFASVLSLVSNSDSPQNPMTSLADPIGEQRDHRGLHTDRSISSTLDRSMGDLRNISGENGWIERLQDPDITFEKLRGGAVALARQVEISELELQTLRKQVVKESRRGQDLLRELGNLKEERDALRKECEQMKISQKRSNNDAASMTFKFDGEEPWSMLEELKQELDHEKNLNLNLRLQLEKTQEANSELILAVRDLDELLEQKSRESPGCSTIAIKSESIKEARGIVDQLVCLQTSKRMQESFEITSDRDDEEQHDLEELVKEHRDVRVGYSVEQQIIGLKSEVELYSKDREELEMQMEQLALDYEILKQENHEISLRLEQTQLREQLRMQYECSAHLAIITDLEAHIDSLEKELLKQAEAFEADLETITQAKVKQEQRAIQAEEALRKTRWKNASTVEQLQEEFKRLSVQMSSTFYENEKLAMQALAEASDLRMEKYHMEDLLNKSLEDLSSAEIQYKLNLQELLSLLDIKTKEIDKLTIDFKNKCEDLENQKKSDEAKQKASLEEKLMLKSELEKLLREKDSLSEQIRRAENLSAEMGRLKIRSREIETLLEERNMERGMLEKEVSSLKMDVMKSKEELSDLRYLKEDQEETIRILSYEMEALKKQYLELQHKEARKENLRTQIIQLKGGVQKEEDIVADGVTIRMDNGTNNESSISPNSVKEFSSLHGKFEFCKGIVPKDERDALLNFNPLFTSHLQEFNDKANAISFPNGKGSPEGDKASMYDPNDLEREVKIRCSESHSGKDGDFHFSKGNVSEILSEMAVLKERNESMEAELKEMQQRYSEISLKFAEVEGERQQLVMTIRALKKVP